MFDYKTIVNKGVFFEFDKTPESIPDDVVNALASPKVLLVGESHYMQEHQEFFSVLLKELHKTGLRRFTTEGLYAYGLLFDDYVKGLSDELSSDQKNLDLVVLEGIRNFNARLRAAGLADEQISISCFDINHWPTAFCDFLDYFLENRITEVNTGLLEAAADLRSALQDTEAYAASFVQFDKLVNAKNLTGISLENLKILKENLKVETVSLGIRNRWNDKTREDLIYEQVEKEIARLNPGEQILVNCGMWHAQFSEVWSTGSKNKYEWLGMRLQKKFADDPGALYSLAVFAYRGQSKARFNSIERNNFDCQKKGFFNNLTKTLDLAAKNRTTFLDFKTLSLADVKIPIDFGASFSTQKPGKQFSGILIFPLHTVLKSSLYYEK